MEEIVKLLYEVAEYFNPDFKQKIFVLDAARDSKNYQLFYKTLGTYDSHDNIYTGVLGTCGRYTEALDEVSYFNMFEDKPISLIIDKLDLIDIKAAEWKARYIATRKRIDRIVTRVIEVNEEFYDVSNPEDLA